MPNRDIYSSRTATVRDFSGGWNVSDNDHNLASKYQSVSDNVVVAADGALTVRQGYRYFSTVRSGVSTSFTNKSVTWGNSGAFTTIAWTAHPFKSGNHITLTSNSAGTFLPMNIPYGITVIDANTIGIVLRAGAVVSNTAATISGSYDTHALAGKIIDCTYFQGYWIIFDDCGEVAAIDPVTGNALQIWNTSISYGGPSNPTGWCRDVKEAPLPYVSFDTFKQTLLAVNGRTRDKPIEISFSRTVSKGNWSPGIAYVLQDTVLDPTTGLTWRCCKAHTSSNLQNDIAAGNWVSNITLFLADPASSSNAAVPRGEFIQSIDAYTLIYGTDSGTKSIPTTLDISMLGTSSVFQANSSPGDAIQVELGRISNTMDPRITGVGNIRDYIFVAFYDTGMLGQVGIYDSTGHKPSFKDQIPQHGAINHRVIQTVGNDLFMCDFAGVPAFSQSMQTGVIVPDRISELIDPELNKHLSRLSPTTLRYYCWSLFNVRDRQYMLWLPKHDSNSVFTGAAIPFYTPDEFAALGQIIVNAPNHTVSAGDYVDVTNAVDIPGCPATLINGRRQIVAIIDSNYFVMSVGGIPTQNNQQGGGSTVSFAPVSDETICYTFCYNPQLRIRRWTRLRGWKFDAGTISVEGKVMLCDGTSGKLYFLGTVDKPVYADAYGDWDATYSAGTLYSVGTRVKDTTDGSIWSCLVSYTSSSNSFSTERTNYPNNWTTYVGNPINFAAETPWSDFGDRTAIKVNSQVQLDTEGSARFKFSVFTDNIYQDKRTYTLAPSASASFLASGAGGFGAREGTFGGGPRTREQLNYHFPFRCKIAKMRFEGSVTDPLKIISVNMTYMKGSSQR